MALNLESQLQRGLRPVSAPPELWDRVQSARVSRPQDKGRKLVWALALAVVLAAVALSRSPLRQDPQQITFHCQNPAQLRAWVRANTGLDVPLRAAPPASIQLIGARAGEGRVEIAYRAGGRDGVLRVSPSGVGSADGSHSRVSGDVSSWVMAGQRYTLASSDASDLQLACKLCHLD